MSKLGFFFGLLYGQWTFTPPRPTKSFKGQTVIVTGSNVGLGFEAVKHIVRLGASKVIIAVRSIEKGEAARKVVISETGCKPDIVEVWQLDLSSYQSVKSFAKRAQGLDRLDVLLENAGISTASYVVAEEDESTVTVNVVSTFLLALLLLPKLKETASRYNTRPHLVVVSSELHFLTKITTERKAALKKFNSNLFAALSDKSTANMGDRYQVSKLLEVFAVREIVKNYMSSPEYPVTMNFVNPGFCHSSLMREIPKAVQHTLKFIMSARTTEVGSRTLVDAASQGHESHGKYMSDCKVTDPAAFVESEEGARLQTQVWNELSEKLERIEPGILKNL
jgi:retinol dehydrogenase 12